MFLEGLVVSESHVLIGEGILSPIEHNCDLLKLNLCIYGERLLTLLDMLAVLGQL